MSNQDKPRNPPTGSLTPEQLEEPTMIPGVNAPRAPAMSPMVKPTGFPTSQAKGFPQRSTTSTPIPAQGTSAPAPPVVAQPPARVPGPDLPAPASSGAAQPGNIFEKASNAARVAISGSFANPLLQKDKLLQPTRPTASDPQGVTTGEKTADLPAAGNVSAPPNAALLMQQHMQRIAPASLPVAGTFVNPFFQQPAQEPTQPPPQPAGTFVSPLFQQPPQPAGTFVSPLFQNAQLQNAQPQAPTSGSFVNPLFQQNQVPTPQPPMSGSFVNPLFPQPPSGSFLNPATPLESLSAPVQSGVFSSGPQHPASVPTRSATPEPQPHLETQPLAVAPPLWLGNGAPTTPTESATVSAPKPAFVSKAPPGPEDALADQLDKAMQRSGATARRASKLS